MDSSRPRFETVEVENSTVTPPVVPPSTPNANPMGTTPLVPEDHPQIAKKGVKHHIGKFVFLIPAFLILGTIFGAAYFFNNTFRQYVQPTPAPTVTPTAPPATPEPTLPPIAKLNSYQAEKFSFSYLSELSVTECDDTVYLKPATSSAELNGDCAEVKADYTLSVKSSKTAPVLNTKDADESELTVNGVDAKKYTSIQDNGDYVEFVVFDQVLVNEITPTYFVIRNQFGNDYNGEFNKIIETFRLVKVDPTEEWEAYEDITYDFSFKYPPEWTLVPPPEKSKDTKRIVEVRKNAEEFKLHTLHIEAEELESKPEVSAGEIIISTRNLAGWATKPPIEYRNIGGGTAQVLQGILEDKWHTFVIIWRKNTFIQMSWTDTLEKPEQETFNYIFSSFKFLN